MGAEGHTCVSVCDDEGASHVGSTEVDHSVSAPAVSVPRHYAHLLLLQQLYLCACRVCGT